VVGARCSRSSVGKKLQRLQQEYVAAAIVAGVHCCFSSGYCRSNCAKSVAERGGSNNSRKQTFVKLFFTLLLDKQSLRQDVLITGVNNHLYLCICRLAI
jgi:F0F1-type ATP synthase membrane subunit c/vacuolar-type H+-ATPase subunit K